MTSDKKHKSNIKKIGSYALPFILMAVFLYLAFKNVDLGEAFYLIGEDTSITYLIFFIAVFYFSHILRALRWKVIISSVKKDASIFNLFGATMIGYGVNCVIPRLGELYRGLFAGKWEGLSRSSMLGTIIVERIIDILSLGFSVLISVMIYPGNLYQDIPWLKSALVLGFIAIIVIIIILALLVMLKEKFYNAIVKFVGKISVKASQKLADIFKTLILGFSSLKGWKTYVLTIILSVAIMLVYGYNSYIGFYMLGMQNFHEITFSMAWVLMTIMAFGIIIPTPGGTGSYHAIGQLVMVSLFGFTSEAAAAYVILTHAISYVFFISSTVFFTFVVNKIQIRKGGRKENFFSVFRNTKEEE